jgi:L-arabinose isomerase
LKTAATAWISAGGAHHTALSRAITTEHLQNFADIAGIECLVINRDTTVAGFQKELRWNDMYYHFADGIRN